MPFWANYYRKGQLYLDCISTRNKFVVPSAHDIVIRMPLSEKKLIAQIRRKAGGGASVLKGIGDDCAVLRVPKGHQILVTTDFTIERVHFLRHWHSPELVGWRCLTRGLSDIAAMGGEPLAVFLSLAIAGEVSQEWVNGFMKGVLKLAKDFEVPLAGGDTAQAASGIQADIIVVGSVPNGQAVLRSGAKAGDRIYVTGSLGASAAEISTMKSTTNSPSRKTFQIRQIASRSGLRPTPRLAVGQWLRKHSIASAMIDISDGLSTDLNHICEESSVGADIAAENIPLGRWPGATDVVALPFALHGGEDYELLFTSSKAVPKKIAGVAVTPIGMITRSRGMRLVNDGKFRRLPVQGWEHFKKP